MQGERICLALVRVICLGIIIEVFCPAVSTEFLRYSYRLLAFSAIEQQLRATSRAVFLFHVICSAYAPNHAQQPDYYYLLHVFKLFGNSFSIRESSRLSVLGRTRFLKRSLFFLGFHSVFSILASVRSWQLTGGCAQRHHC